MMKTADLAAEILQQLRADMSTEELNKLSAGHFTGKRAALRTLRFLDVVVEGKHGKLDAVAVDLSRSGMLLRIIDPAFSGEFDVEQLMAYTARVWHHFSDGLKATFGEDQTTKRLKTDVVRVTSHGGLVLIGCRFQRLLTRGQCRKLGIEWADDRGPDDDGLDDLD